MKSTWGVVVGLASVAAAGSPVPPEFDCELRRFAVDFAKHIQPEMTGEQLLDLVDALNGAPEAACRNLTAPISTSEPRVRIEGKRPENAIFVAMTGSDSNAGGMQAPMRTIAAALERARDGGHKTIALRGGTYREESPLRLTAEHSGLTIVAYDGELVEITGAKKLSPSWKPARVDAGQNIWVTTVPSSVGAITGLRVDGRRAIRARYPNADPERTLNPDGWIEEATKWLPPRVTHLTDPPVEYQVSDPQWTRNDSTGNELRYQAGINGSCSHFDPPYGYWCSARPARDVSGRQTHKWPSGLVYEGRLPNAPYKNATGAIVHSCRGGANCWFTWMFEVDKQSIENKTLSWFFGGFQGAEGTDSGGTWYIENVMEELDAPHEFFHDQQAGKLYYFHNSTSGTPPPAGMIFETPSLKVLMNVSGTMDKPVRDIHISGITFRDTPYTYMDPHGLPSSGDWALARSGALLFEGTENLVVDRCNITHVDGNGISINGYNRDFTVQNSEISWIGSTAIAAWGYTEQGRGGGDITLPQEWHVGIDGTAGEQPRHTKIIGNIIHEVGLFQKQSSMYFQAQTCQTTIERNVFYNGPRAHINFNDMFGGANRITKNLILNACRETADHGPFNSWGRFPFITEVRNGTPSITPAFNEIDHNMIFGSYNTQEAIDNDDASEYFSTHHNFFAYGDNGLKNDFAGHDNIQYNNVYAFVGSTCMDAGVSFKPGHEDAYYNNTCVMRKAGSPYAVFDCKGPLPTMHDNQVYTPTGETFQTCKMNFAAWQAAGHDIGTTISKWPDSHDLIRWGASAVGVRSSETAPIVLV